MPDTQRATAGTDATARGLARCLTALELEARALHRPLAATLIGAAAAVLQEDEPGRQPAAPVPAAP